MYNLKTIYTSNIPIRCHIIKGRLESEGIDCYIYDENIVWVHPFKAVAIGGVKLKVSSKNYDKATVILKLLEQNKLHDTEGEYDLSATFEQNYQTQTAILNEKSELRNNSTLLTKPDQRSTHSLSNELLSALIKEEYEYQRLNNLRLNFTIKQFLYELFDFNRSVFAYLRLRPVNYYLDQELVAYHESFRTSRDQIVCPHCGSENVNYGNAIDNKWDFLYLILSFIIFVPFLLIRKKFHCFECKNDFKIK